MKSFRVWRQIACEKRKSNGKMKETWQNYGFVGCLISSKEWMTLEDIHSECINYYFDHPEDDDAKEYDISFIIKSLNELEEAGYIEQAKINPYSNDIVWFLDRQKDNKCYTQL